MENNPFYDKSKFSFGVTSMFPLRVFGRTYDTYQDLYADASRKPAVAIGGFKSRLIRYYGLWAEPDDRAVEHCLYDRLHKFDVGGVIYKITHIESGLIYIGVTDCPQLRIPAHFKLVEHPVTPLQKYIAKYGAESFVVEEIARLRCCRAVLEEIEQALITKYNSVWPNGLNGR